MTARTHRIVLLVVCALTLAQAAAVAVLVRGPIPIHFDSDGQPNRWGSAGSLVIPELVMTGLTLVFFLWLPLFLPRLSEQHINLPNKGYWLAPERRGDTLAYLQRLFHLQGVANQLFIVTLTTLIVLGSRSAEGRPPMTPMLALIAAFTLSIFAMVGRLIWRFSRRPLGAG